MQRSGFQVFCCNPLNENTTQNQHKSINRLENCFKNSISPRAPAFCRRSLLNVEGSLSGVRHKDTVDFSFPAATPSPKTQPRINIVLFFYDSTEIDENVFFFWVLVLGTTECKNVCKRHKPPTKSSGKLLGMILTKILWLGGLMDDPWWLSASKTGTQMRMRHKCGLEVSDHWHIRRFVAPQMK